MTSTELATTDQPIITAAGVSDQGTYGLYAIENMRASPDNRKRFSEQGLQELAASIKAMGVAQAILIRPVTPTADATEEFEIVAGERRFRASKIAGKTHIPALCRQLSDLDAARIRILENLQREDPHPMEEAEGYQLLMLQHGFSADQLVDEVKKSRAYIYGRLKLCALTSEVREMFLDDKLSASTALLVARIPVPALQIKAATEILTPDWQGNTMSHRAAATHIQNRYMLKLGAAVFSLSDAKLLASAGSCVKCPKRAGNQPEVFEGIDPNVCTDPDCFAEKKAAHYNATITAANKKGIPIFEASEMHALISKSWSRDSELVHADMHLSYFERNAPATGNSGYVKDHLNSDTLPAAAAYAKKGDDQVIVFYRRTDVQRALEAVGACETVEAHAERMQSIAENPELAPTKTAAQLRREKEAEEHAAARAQKEKESAFRLSVYKQLRQRASIAGLSLLSLREYVRAVHDDRGLDSDVHSLYDFDVRTDLDEFINHADANALQLLLLDLMLGDRLDAAWWHGDADDDEFAPIMAMARHEGIDVDAIRAEALQPETPIVNDEPVHVSINVTNMQYDDLMEFLKDNPDRINELNTAINASPRGDLTGQLAVAANHFGYNWNGTNFEKVSASTAEHTEDTLSTTVAEQVDATPSAAPAETPATTEQTDPPQVAAEQAPAQDQDEGAQLAEQLAEVTPTSTDREVQTSAPEKKAKAKQAPAKKAQATTSKKATATATAKAKS